jgi:hypothetical protein
METRRKVTEIERIARIFKLRPDEENIVLKVQDIVKAKDSEINKKKFSNDMLWAKIKKYEAEINNLHNEFAESVGITEHMMVKQSRDEINKNYQKLLEENHNLKETIRNYREYELNNKLDKIVNG